MRGIGTSTSGTVALLDDTDEECATVGIEENDEGFGAFAFTDEASHCPDAIRAGNGDGSVDTAPVE